jgi:hypothetical protein
MKKPVRTFSDEKLLSYVAICMAVIAILLVAAILFL